jgi:hypothetical protein
VGGKSVGVPSQDFEFTIAKDGTVSFQAIHRPMPRVAILPGENVFVGSVDVRFEHPEKDVEIRYTLDGSEPTLESPVYSKPVRLEETTKVRAIAVRKGTKKLAPTTDSTHVSLPATAQFTKAPGFLPATKVGALKPGLAYKYFEDDWTLSLLKLPILSPIEEGTAREWMDVAMVKESGNPFAVIYEGYLKVPKDGIYTFHGPWEFYDVGERAAYDLKVMVNGQPWYPSSRDHNYGNWSVPLAAGNHAIQISYVDIRRGTNQAGFPTSFYGEKPEIQISGPDLPKQAVPADWLFHP